MPIVEAFLGGEARFNVRALPADVLDHAFDAGLGAIMGHISRDAPDGRLEDGSLEGTDLTARLLTDELLDAVEKVLGAARADGCDPILLKGCATGLQFYPEPHLRTVGDVDLLAPQGQLEVLDSTLRRLGFDQPDRGRTYDTHHHSQPFFDAERSVWIEAHSQLFPPYSPALTATTLTPDAIAGHLTRIPLRAGSVRVMNRELQLVYTAARWAEMVNTERGIFPILDAALIIAAPSPVLDWDRVFSLVGPSWAASALHLLLSYLERYALVRSNGAVMRELAARDRFSTRVTRLALHHLVTGYVFERRVLSRRVLRTAWSTLSADMHPLLKIPAVALNLAIRPPDDRPLRLRRVSVTDPRPSSRPKGGD